MKYLSKVFSPPLFLMLIGTCALAETQMPIGVPDPTGRWGEEQRPIEDTCPDRPADWGTEIGGYYFVNYETGSDQGRNYGTPVAPRKTIPRPVPAGAYVEVAGAYSHIQGGAQFIEARGDSSQWVPGISGPVWVTTNGPVPGSFTSSKVIVYGSYLYIDNARFANGGAIQISSPSNGYPAEKIVVRDSVFEGVPDVENGRTLLSVGASDSDSATDVIFLRNHAFNAGDIDSPTDDDDHIVSIGHRSSNVWVLDNHLHNSSGAGVQVLGASKDHGISNIYVARNNIHDVRQSGVWLKHGKDVVFSENTIYDVRDTPWSPSKCAGAQYRPEGLWIIYNRLSNCRYGVRVPSTDGDGIWDVFVIGNLITKIGGDETPDFNTSWDPAAIHFHGATNRHIENNLIYSSVSGIHFSGGGGRFHVQNNIISDLTSENGMHIWVEIGKGVSEIDHNLLSQKASQPHIKWGTGQAFTLLEFQQKVEQCQSCFVGTAGLDADLKPTSIGAVLDKGRESNVANIFRERFGIGLDLDISHKQRITGAAIDLGPYEVSSDIHTIRPTAPKTLEAND